MPKYLRQITTLKKRKTKKVKEVYLDNPSQHQIPVKNFSAQAFHD